MTIYSFIGRLKSQDGTLNSKEHTNNL